MEFRDQLEEIAEGEEAAVECPGWPLDGSLDLQVFYLNVAFSAAERDTLLHKFLPRVRSGVDATNCGLGDAVLEAKASMRYQRLKVC